MIVAIHQPLFAPWSGYFHKMLLADRFIVLDHVAYTHHNRINRNEIRLADGRRSWLTVPVRTHGREGEPILAVEIAERENPRWRDKHLRTLRQHYGAAPHFAAFAPEIESIYPRAGPSRWPIAVMRPVHAAKTTARQLAGLWSAIRGSRSRPAR